MAHRYDAFGLACICSSKNKSVVSAYSVASTAPRIAICLLQQDASAEHGCFRELPRLLWPLTSCSALIPNV
jgi:hypothetical protein